VRPMETQSTSWRRPIRSHHPSPVIPSEASRRLFFAFTSGERVGLRREESAVAFRLASTPPTAPDSDSSPQTASDANTDTLASDRSPCPPSPPDPPLSSIPPPADSAEAAPHSSRQSPRCPPSASATTNSAQPPAPASRLPSKPLPAR